MSVKAHNDEEMIAFRRLDRKEQCARCGHYQLRHGIDTAACFGPGSKQYERYIGDKRSDENGPCSCERFVIETLVGDIDLIRLENK